MLIIKNKKIEDYKYNALMVFMYSCCDMVSFRLPNFNEVVINEKNAELSPNRKFGTYPGDIEEFRNYKEYLQEDLLEELTPHIIDFFVDVEYGNSLYEYNSEIYYISLVEETRSYITSERGLYDWMYPECPEDLCFYKKGKCFLESISHENLCRIYTDDDYDKLILKKIGLKYIEIPGNDAPTASYVLKY